MFCPAISPPYKVPPFPHPQPPATRTEAGIFLNSRQVYTHNEIEKSDHNFFQFL